MTPRAQLLGGPCDGATLGNPVDSTGRPLQHIEMIDPPPRPTLTGFRADPLEPLIPRHYLYRRERVIARGPHPCVAGLTVTIEAVGYVHDRILLGSEVVTAMVAARGQREVQVTADWDAAHREAERCWRAGLRGNVWPAARWAVRHSRWDDRDHS